MENKFMILISIPEVGDMCWDVIVQSHETVRKSLDGNKCVVKMPSGEADIPECLADHIEGGKEYTHEGILIVLAGSEWKRPDIL